MARKRTLLVITALIISLAVVVTAFILARPAHAAPSQQHALSSNASAANENSISLHTTSTSITAFNAMTGATIWTFQPGGFIDPPSIVKQSVYVVALGTSFPTLYTLNLHTGATLWTFHPNGYLNLPVFDNAHSLYITVDSLTPNTTTLYKLATSTGATLWTFQSGTHLSNAIVLSDNTVYISTGYPSSVYALRASNGKQLWHSQSINAAFSLQKVVGDMLYANSQGPQLSFGLLYAFSSTRGAFLWTTDGALQTATEDIAYIKTGTIASPEICALNSDTGSKLWCALSDAVTVAKGLAYVITGQTTFQVFNATTGTLLWSQNHEQFFTLQRGVVYTVDQTNAIVARNATDGAPLWRSAVTYGISSGISIVNGNMYADSVGTFSVYSLKASDGTLRWSFPLPTGVASLSIAHGIVSIITFDNSMYALNASNGMLLWHH